MLDLNLSFVHEDERTMFRGEVEESGTSNSSIVNAEGCNSSNACDGDGDGDEDSSSAAGDGDMFHCFNFGILNVGDTGAKSSNSNDEDRTSQTQIRSEFVTRTLFPMSHGGGRFNQGQQVNSFLLFPNNNELQKRSLVQVQQQKPTVQQNQAGKKSRRGPRSRSSQYRGVTFYRRTGRWESHIWDCGKQVYLGGFDTAHAAARAYDRAAIKFRGVDADINFNLSDYEEDMNQIKNLSKEDFVHILRRQTNGISRGSSKYKGVTTHKFGRWEARMGQILGKKAYDNAAIKSSQRETVNNFDASMYEREAVSASHHGIDQSLDLKLGISTSSFLGKDSTRNENLEHIQLNDGSRDPIRLQVDIPSTTTLKGLPVISDHYNPWTGLYPAIVPGYEGGALNTRIIPGSTQGPANWSRQMHGQSQTPTTAASSGFPAPTATAGVHSTLPHYYYHIRPPPPLPP